MTNSLTSPCGGWQETALLFGLPGVAVLLTTHLLNPYLVTQGVPLIWSFSLALYGVVLALAIAAVVLFRAEGNPWHTFAHRMRFRRMSGRDWLWTGGAVVIALLGDGLLEPTMNWLATTLPLPIPAALPALFDPLSPLELPPDEFFGVPLAGNLWVAAWYAVLVTINIGGEELWWRGYILPRQEQFFGRWAWLVNGLMWIIVFHAFMWWSYPTILFTGLLAPYMAQKLQNTWPAIFIHGMGNTLFIFLILIGTLSA